MCVCVVCLGFFLLCRHFDIKDIKACGSQPLPGSIHTSTAGTCSIPHKDLDGITKRLTVNTFSGISKNAIPGAWSLCLELAKEENFEIVGRAWQSIFCVIGDVVQNKKVAPLALTRSWV